MKTHFRNLYIGVILGLFLVGLSTTIPAKAWVKAQIAGQIETPIPTSQYFNATSIRLNDGKLVDKYTISGPPNPPAGYELERAAVALPQPNQAMAMNTLTVPAYEWIYGCSSVSAAMIAGYYDRTAYPNMYTGPTNGGVAPIDSSPWSSWTDSVGETYPQNPLIASHQGLDGRSTRGSLDDYWVGYMGGVQDPYLTNSWTQHTWGDAIGDYMKTSQSAYGNDDGSTGFYTYTSSPAALTCSQMLSGGISSLDGTYGRKLFYEAKGYTVTDCYNQKTDNTIAGGFSLAMYKAEIDAGHPVLLNLAGHSIVGVGYDTASNTIYIHDTWDIYNHTMTWGGSYSGMGLLSVSIVNLAPGANNPPNTPSSPTPSNGSTGASLNPALSWTGGDPDAGDSVTYDVYLQANTNPPTTLVSLNQAGTSYTASTLNASTPYYWKIVARDSHSSVTSGPVWSFTTQAANTPTAPSSPIPADTTTLDRTSDTTLSWTTNGTTCDVHIWGGAININPSGGSCASLHLGNQYPGSFQWQVTAHNNTGGITSGPVWHFNIRPYAPSSLHVSSSSQTSIELAWTKSVDDPGSVDTYKIYNGGGSYINSVSAGVTNYSVSGLTPNTTYSFYVTAVRQGVESLSSNLINVQTPAGSVFVSTVWLTDANGNGKTTFARNDDIVYWGEIDNFTGSSQNVDASWEISGPCGDLDGYSGSISVDAGQPAWYLPGTIPDYACLGSYTYKLSVTYQGVTTAQTIDFEVVPQETPLYPLYPVFLPLLKK
jgi:hypothetical protein